MRRPYPCYRDSGVEWLGKIPDHWEARRLGRIGSFFKGGGGTKEDEADEGVPCVRYGDLYTEHQFLITHTRARIAEEATDDYMELEHGDVLFAGSGETIEEIGKSAANLIEGPAYCGGDVIVFRPAVEADATYLGYTADCQPSVYQKACMGRGVTVMHIYSRELKRMLIPLPPLEEQRAIAEFLDRETGRIDQLVGKKRSLIERLEEYRQALITRTVTRGVPQEAARAANQDRSLASSNRRRKPCHTHARTQRERERERERERGGQSRPAPSPQAFRRRMARRHPRPLGGSTDSALVRHRERWDTRQQ